MLTHGEDVEVHALRQRGWTISAIARHLGRDRKTIRAYINGTRTPGVRTSSRSNPLEPFITYIGTLPHSGRIRGVLAEKMDQAHLIEAMDGVLRRLGGTAHTWRTDRLATVIVPGTADVQASFAPVAKHYDAIVQPCPPRRGNRKGSVESSVRFVSGRWWRTMTAANPEDAQRSLDVFLATTGDERERRGPNGERTSVSALADAEPLLALPPAPFPASTEVERVVAANASVAFQGNRYSVPPGLSGTTLRLGHRLGSPTLDVVAPSGAVLVTHRLAPAGSGALVRSIEHRAALEAAVLSSFTTARPCDTKANRPPGAEALAEAARLLGPIGAEPSVDLSVYGEIAQGR